MLRRMFGRDLFDCGSPRLIFGRSPQTQEIGARFFFHLYQYRCDHYPTITSRGNDLARVQSVAVFLCRIEVASSTMGYLTLRSVDVGARQMASNAKHFKCLRHLSRPV